MTSALRRLMDSDPLGVLGAPGTAPVGSTESVVQFLHGLCRTDTVAYRRQILVWQTVANEVGETLGVAAPQDWASWRNVHRVAVEDAVVRLSPLVRRFAMVLRTTSALSQNLIRGFSRQLARRVRSIHLHSERGEFLERLLQPEALVSSGNSAFTTVLVECIKAGSRTDLWREPDLDWLRGMAGAAQRVGRRNDEILAEIQAWIGQHLIAASELLKTPGILTDPVARAAWLRARAEWDSRSGEWCSGLDAGDRFGAQLAAASFLISQYGSLSGVSISRKSTALDVS